MLTVNMFSQLKARVHLDPSQRTTVLNISLEWWLCVLELVRIRNWMPPKAMCCFSDLNQLPMLVIIPPDVASHVHGNQVHSEKKRPPNDPNCAACLYWDASKFPMGLRWQLGIAHELDSSKLRG